MAQTVALGLQAFAIAGGFETGGFATLGGTANTTPDKGKEYDKFQTIKLMGFARVWASADLPTIWGKFESTKHPDVHCTLIMKNMETWACQNGAELNVGFYFDDTLIKEWTSLKFHPGDIRAQASTAERGITPLACQPVCGSLMEQIKDWDKAEAITMMTKKSTKAVAKKNCAFCTPPSMYAKLREMVTGFCALLWALFGELSPIYKGVLLICSTLMSLFCASQQHKYNGLLSKEITWAILEDCRSFFSADNLADNVIFDRMVFPTSWLHHIEDKIYHGDSLGR